MAGGIRLAVNNDLSKRELDDRPVKSGMPLPLGLSILVWIALATLGWMFIAFVVRHL